MYKIISSGGLVALVDEPHYIKIKPSTGVYIKADKETGQGVAVSGTPYNLPGHTEIEWTVEVDEEEGATDTVTAPEARIIQVDGGEIVYQHEGRIEEVDETAMDGLVAVTDLYEELIDKGVL